MFFMSDTDDVIFDEEDGEGNTKSPAQQLKDFREKLKALQKEKEEYLDGWQRAKADAVNIRKQSEQDRTQAYSRAKEDLIESLLPVLDSLDQALAVSGGEADTWKQGLEQIRSQFLSILTNHDVVAFSPEGEEFSPMEHEPMGVVAVKDESEDNVVLTVLQKGYRIGQKVIRPARVQIGRLEQ
jgi:molecular chaperone GrpE